MKKTYLLFLVIISMFMMSCGGHFFNPRYYYNKSSSSSLGGAPDTAPETPPEEVNPDEDPFLKGDWNSPTYGGYDGSKFDNWLFKASFQADKLPIYTFFDDDKGRYWISGGKDWNDISAEYYNGIDGENYADSSVMKSSITELKVYKYAGYNPLYNSSGYLEGRIDRFNFYAINGKAVVVTLKQYLIAVDTYSKFVFAYGEITKVDEVSVIGLIKEKVPSQFEAIEKYADKRPFFEYDPIGYVKEDGSVVLYKHYIDEFVASPTTYEPKIHLDFTSMAEHREDGQGRSPYLPVKELEEMTADNITITAKRFKNISGRSAEGYLKWFTPKFDDIRDYGYFTYTISGAAYDSEVSDGTLTDIEHLDPRDDSLTGMIYVSEVKKIDKNNYIDFNSSKSFEIKNIDENVCIDLASRIFKYNTLTALGITCIDTDNFGEGGSGEVASKDMPKLKLKYDVDNEQFVIDTEKYVMSNDNLSVTISSYPTDFTLKRGESKDITIRYKWMKGNDTSNGEEFEITYTLKFESII
ncbi:hypothetical protein R4K54_08430 [Brachyspira murdochii]|uniref:hypothetical protein n=1 Tax=Brachyspira murdochii TaxID=84378 RepID=UPI0030052F74